MNVEKEKENSPPISIIFALRKPKCKVIWIKETNGEYLASTSLLRCILGVVSPSLTGLLNHDTLKAIYEAYSKPDFSHIAKCYYFTANDVERLQGV